MALRGPVSAAYVLYALTEVDGNEPRPPRTQSARRSEATACTTYSSSRARYRRYPNAEGRHRYAQSIRAFQTSRGAEVRRSLHIVKKCTHNEPHFA
ncbi:hypothetical protein MRX96_050144, partial [Rhipicephalus microplus]